MLPEGQKNRRHDREIGETEGSCQKTCQRRGTERRPTARLLQTATTTTTAQMELRTPRHPHKDRFTALKMYRHHSKWKTQRSALEYFGELYSHFCSTELPVILSIPPKTVCSFDKWKERKRRFGHNSQLSGHTRTFRTLLRRAKTANTCIYFWCSLNQSRFNEQETLFRTEPSEYTLIQR